MRKCPKTRLQQCRNQTIFRDVPRTSISYRREGEKTGGERGIGKKMGGKKRGREGRK
jgi:hypothetical protein